MIVLLRPGAPTAIAQDIERLLINAGLTPRRAAAPGRLAIEGTGPAPLSSAQLETLRALDGVETILDSAEPTPQVRAASAELVIPTPRGPLSVGTGTLTFAFGPCSVALDERAEEDLDCTADAAARAGAWLLRGGAYKPRTSPYAFQGSGEDGLRLLRRVADRHGLALVSEAMDEASLQIVAAHAELVQIGARSMASTPLLKAAARIGRPLLLKRGFGATVDEWLLAAEYLLDGGAPGVILCERGIRTFEPGTRATLDVGGLALARLRTRLPIFADPSHAAGTRPLVAPLALAAIAAGADGLIIECHPDAARARSDGPQALALEDLAPLAEAARAVARAAKRPEELCSTPWPKKIRSTSQSSASPR